MKADKSASCTNELLSIATTDSSAAVATAETLPTNNTSVVAVANVSHNAEHSQHNQPTTTAASLRTQPLPNTTTPNTTMATTTAAAASSTTTCFNTADRYGVVFNTLLENKMLAIKQQSGTTTVADKRKVRRGGENASKATAADKAKKRRSLANTLTQCVRRGSSTVPAASSSSQLQHSVETAPANVGDIDIELGQIMDHANSDDSDDGDGDDNDGVGGTALDADDDVDASACFTDVDELELPPDGGPDAEQLVQQHQLNGNNFEHHLHTDASTKTYCQSELPAVLAISLEPHCSTLIATAAAPVANISQRDQDPTTTSDAMMPPSSTTPSSSARSSQHTRSSTTARLQHHQRIMEARSISAQASPLLPRTHASGSTPSSIVRGVQHHNVTITENRLIEQQEPSQLPMPPLQQHAPVDTSVYRFAQSLSQSLSAVKTCHERGHAARPFTVQGGGVSVESDGSSSHGFINNFNELTAHSLSNAIYVSRPVITSTTAAMVTTTDDLHNQYRRDQTQQQQQRCRPGWPSRPSSFDRRSTDRYSPDGMAGTTAGDGSWDYRSTVEQTKKPTHRTRMLTMDAGDGAGEVVDRLIESKWTSRRKYRHRGSDPVLIYPSSSGLPQCLLSMPPNRSIQIKYDDNTQYDVSLELDRKHTKKDAAARKSGHSSRHHHHHQQQQQHRHHQYQHQHNNHHHHHQHGNNSHHHSHRHHRTHRTHHDDPEGGRRHERRHKKRILVHDLDTQKVKVIDPDDLPQRARWTIIATACLLLIMCLLLVGVTLRMAPLIDDMVRQENERLQQESLNRARFVRNITDAATAAAAAAVAATFADADVMPDQFPFVP